MLPLGLIALAGLWFAGWNDIPATEPRAAGRTHGRAAARPVRLRRLRRRRDRRRRDARSAARPAGQHPGRPRDLLPAVPAPDARLLRHPAGHGGLEAAARPTSRSLHRAGGRDADGDCGSRLLRRRQLACRCWSRRATSSRSARPATCRARSSRCTASSARPTSRSSSTRRSPGCSTITGTFKYLLAIFVIARMLAYGSTAAALIVLRRREGAAPVPVRGGVVISVLALAACVALIATASFAGRARRRDRRWSSASRSARSCAGAQAGSTVRPGG